MSLNITITKLPRDLDLDKIVEKKMIETYYHCPYCHEKIYQEEYNRYLKKHPNDLQDVMDFAEYQATKSISYSIKKTEVNSETPLYKPIRKNNFFFIKNKKYFWKHISYYCERCGMEWSSPDYPVGLCEDQETRNEIFQAYMDSREPDINTLLIGCVDQMKGE